MKKKRCIAVVVVTMVTLLCAGCGASWDRTVKSYQSNYGGGLNRTVTVYDMQGDPIAEYSGKIDLEENEGKVLFDLNGKRTVIYNATVIAQEN